MKTKESGSTTRITASLTKAVDGMLPEIRLMIEEARHRAVTAANLSMVTLYWNIGRVINTEVQKAPGRAGGLRRSPAGAVGRSPQPRVWQRIL